MNTTEKTIKLTPPTKAKGSIYGDYVRSEGKASAEELAKMKAEVVEKVCDAIRRIASEADDFFIIKTVEENGEVYTTVGAKFILPTVEDPWLPEGEDAG